MESLQELIQFFEQNKEVGIAVAIVAGIIVLLIVIQLLKLIWRMLTFPFRLLSGEKDPKEVSQLHRSKNWGGKPHVDLYERDAKGKVISQDHGHSPTIYPPPRENGAVKLRNKKDLPPPFGKVD
jgi:hypothetical protein